MFSSCVVTAILGKQKRTFRVLLVNYLPLYPRKIQQYQNFQSKMSSIEYIAISASHPTKRHTKATLPWLGLEQVEKDRTLITTFTFSQAGEPSLVEDIMEVTISRSTAWEKMSTSSLISSSLYWWMLIFEIPTSLELRQMRRRSWLHFVKWATTMHWRQSPRYDDQSLIIDLLTSPGLWCRSQRYRIVKAPQLHRSQEYLRWWGHKRKFPGACCRHGWSSWAIRRSSPQLSAPFDADLLLQITYMNGVVMPDRWFTQIDHEPSLVMSQKSRHSCTIICWISIHFSEKRAMGMASSRLVRRIVPRFSF